MVTSEESGILGQQYLLVYYPVQQSCPPNQQVAAEEMRETEIDETQASEVDKNVRKREINPYGMYLREQKETCKKKCLKLDLEDVLKS